MSQLNSTFHHYSLRLRENLQDIPFTIYEHLLSGNSILKPKQQEAAHSAADKMFDGFKRAIALIMPTGTGKTVILAQMLAGLKEDEKSGKKPKKIIIVTDSEEGVKNTRNKLKEFANINAGVYYGDEKDIKNKQVVVTTYNSWQDADFPIDPEDIDLVVLDEAHKGISEARMETLQKHENSIFLALTASPTYDEERDLLKHFELAYKMTVQDAVIYNLISSFRNIILNGNVAIDLEKMAESEEGLDSALEREMKSEAMSQDGIRYLVHGVHYDTGMPLRDIRGIVSCVDTEHAESVAAQMNKEYEEAHPDKPFKYKFAEFITGASPNRDEILKRHQAGEIQYLAYADLLNQNYDDKKIGVVLNLRLTESLVLAIQRAGRALRIDEDDLGKIAIIIDIFHKFNGKFKKQPLFYTHAIGSAALITKDAEELAIERSSKGSKVNLERRAEARAEARAMNFDIDTDEESILEIFNDLVFQNSKQADELSAYDMERENHITYEIIIKSLRELIPVEGKDGQYIDPEDCDENPKIYYGAERSTWGRNARVLKRDSVRSFLDNVVLKDRKKEDELSIYDVFVETKISVPTIQPFWNKLVPVESKNGQYIDPEEIGVNPKTYYGAERKVNGKEVRVLKRESVDTFLENFIFKYRKKADEFSAKAIAKEGKTSDKKVRKYLDDLAPLEGKKGQYLDPNDKSENPVVYYGAERIVNEKKIRVLKEESVHLFLNNCVFKDRKKEDESSAVDIAAEMKIAAEDIRDYLYSLNPVEGKEGQYIDPEDKSKSPIIYYGAERFAGGKEIRVLKKESIEPFLQNCVMKNKKEAVIGNKRENSYLSTNQIATEAELDFRNIHKKIKTLKLVEGKEGQYIDPEDKSENQIIYYGKEVVIGNKNVLYLKKESVRSFLDNCVFKYKKREGEFSAKDMGKEKGVYEKVAREHLNNLKPIEGKEGQYIDPEDKSKNPIIYYGAERIVSNKWLRVLNEESVRPFLDNVVLRNKKKSDQLSANDIVDEEKVSKKNVRESLNSLQPIQGKPGQYLDPNDKSENPTIYFCTERLHGKQTIRMLNRDCVHSFLENCVFKGKKREDESSSSDLAKIFLIKDNLSPVLKSYVRVDDNKDLYVHPSGNFKETVKIVTRKSSHGPMLCLKDNSIDLFAKQNGLKYRDLQLEEKYSKSSSTQQPE